MTNIRFGLWLRLLITAPGTHPQQSLDPQIYQPSATDLNRLELAYLAPEQLFSIVPYGLRQSAAIVYDSTPGNHWTGPRTFTWRGVSCDVGIIILWLRNELYPVEHVQAWEPFRLLTLLPQRDPIDPPRTILLASRFLIHYGFRATCNYRAIVSEIDTSTGRRRLDPRAVCGSLEIS